MLTAEKAYTFFIYELFLPSAPRVICYVGRTVQPAYRGTQHNKRRKDAGLEQYGIRILHRTGTSRECAILERHYISTYLAAGHPLTNCNHKTHDCDERCPAFNGTIVTSSMAVRRCGVLLEGRKHPRGARCQVRLLGSRVCWHHAQGIIRCSVTKVDGKPCTMAAEENGRCRFHNRAESYAFWGYNGNNGNL